MEVVLKAQRRNNMLTLDDAILKVNKYLKKIVVLPPTELLLLLDETIEFEYGWTFFYNSKEYIETGNIMMALGGNGAIIVNRYDGSLLQTGSAHPTEIYIEDYIKQYRERLKE